MFWLGLLRAFTSKAQTPILHGFRELDSISLIELAAVLAAVLPLSLLGAWLKGRVDCPIRLVERESNPESAFPDWLWVGFACEVDLFGSNVGSGTGPVGVRSL